MVPNRLKQIYQYGLVQHCTVHNFQYSSVQYNTKNSSIMYIQVVFSVMCRQIEDCLMCQPNISQLNNLAAKMDWPNYRLAINFFFNHQKCNSTKVHFMHILMLSSEVQVFLILSGYVQCNNFMKFQLTSLVLQTPLLPTK